jgi:hypothetical protein
MGFILYENYLSGGKSLIEKSFYLKISIARVKQEIKLESEPLIGSFIMLSRVNIISDNKFSF